MKNFVQPGNTVTLIAPAGGVKSGDGLLVGSLFGVCSYDALEAAEIETCLVGVFDLPATGPIDAGAAVYWDAAAKKVTATALANTLVGAALLAVGGGGTIARVRLNGTTTAITA